MSLSPEPPRAVRGDIGGAIFVLWQSRVCGAAKNL